MSRSITGKLIDVANALIGRIKGSLALVTVVASGLFGAISGSGVATASAIGGLTIPAMKKEGYPAPFAVAVSSISSILGPIIPPSITLIVYASITNVSVSKLFIGSVIPGLLLVVCLMGYALVYAKRNNLPAHEKMPAKEVAKTFKSSIWALLMPIIIIGGVMGGIFTATEAGAVACVYGLIVSVFVYKSMSFKDLINVLRSASVNMAMVMMIIGFSSIFSYIFALEGMGQKIVDFMLSITTSPTGLFFLVIAFMVVIGCFMESLAALPIILPIIYPMFASLGVNLNQLGVVFALSTVLGGLTPPVGIYLFLSMNLTGSKMRDTVLPHMLIVIGIMLLVIVLCILLPIPQFLPDLVFGAAT